jgi:ubiquinone/menaquinone biosynthesis C-methylase UbiE
MERRFDQTAEGWDAASDEYARLLAPHTAEFAKDVVALYGPGETDAVLEVAAGSGTLTAQLAQHAKFVVATDVSPRMIAHIRAGGWPNVIAQVMDAHTLQYAHGEFDAVYCMFGVMFFHERDRALAEMARVLKPGGRCVLVTWHADSRMLAPVKSALEKVMPGAPPTQALQEPPVLGTREELKAELERAGFSEIEVKQVAHTLNAGSRDIYVRDFPRANPMGIMMQKAMPPAAMDALAKHIHGELSAEFGDGPVRLQGVANIACGTR